MRPSFRDRFLAACVVGATVPALLLGAPLLARLAGELRDDAAARLALDADRLGARLDREVELIAARAAAVAQDSDVRRAARVPIFLSKADDILRTFLKENPAASAVVYLDPAGTPITAAPVGLELALSAPARAALRQLAAAPVRAGAAFAVVDERSPGGGGPTLALKVPVRISSDGRVTGSLAVRLRWPALAGAAAAAGERLEVRRVGGGVVAPWSGGTLDDEALYRVRAPLLVGAALAPGDAVFELVLAEPAAALFRAAAQAWRALWLVAAAGVVVLGVAALVLGRRLLRPLDVLTAFVGEYAAGNYGAPPPRLSAGEFQAVVDLLTAMAARVQADLAATERRAEFQTAQIQAELDALKSQLKPHFLFNAINSIAAIAHDRSADTVPMLTKLAELYRLILRSSRHAMQPLTAELAVVRHYLDLEGLRFRERLAYAVEDGGVSGETPVPCLLLQTLVENCVKHGVAPALAGGRVALRLSSAPGGAVAVELVNSGEPLAAGWRAGTGIGNTIRRLDLLYPGRHGFAIGSGDGGETVVRFTFGGSA